MESISERVLCAKNQTPIERNMGARLNKIMRTKLCLIIPRKVAARFPKIIVQKLNRINRANRTSSTFILFLLPFNLLL